jgi:hypothetical protein
MRALTLAARKQTKARKQVRLDEVVDFLTAVNAFFLF